MKNRQKGDPNLSLKYLPPNKQYLEFKGLPCPSRASCVADVRFDETEGDEGEDKWWLISFIFD